MSPDKPTRDSVTESDQPEELYDASAGRHLPDEPHAAVKREARGSAQENGKHPPHQTEVDESANVQGAASGNSGDAAVLPANAQGSDRVSTGEQSRPIDSESMYDGRPAEDKDRPASGREKPEEK
jgi:hypothetical protein